MNFLKPSKLKIILTIPLLVIGIYATFSFMVGTSIGMGTNLLDYLLAGGSIGIVFQLSSVGGIIGLLFGGFLVAFTPPVILFVLAGTFQLFWSYFLSCLLVFLGKKLFSR